MMIRGRLSKFCQHKRVFALVFVGMTAASPPVAGEERMFLLTPQVCHLVGGRASIETEKEDYYTEILGSLSGRPSQMCVAGWLGVRNCINVMLHNFMVVCRGGIASAPAFYMALFGNDKSSLDNGVALSGDTISYIEQSSDVFQQNPRRVALPRGYAPLNNLEPRFRTLNWDGRGGFPLLSRELSDDQRQRIRALFVVRGSHVEPFPVAHINRAAAIGNEPPRPVAASKPPPSAVPTEQKAPSVVPASPAPTTDKAFAFAAAGIIFLFGLWIVQLVPPDSRVGRLIIGTLVAIASSVALYTLGIKDELQIASIAVAGGIIAITVSIFL